MRHGSIPGARGRVRPLTLLGDAVLREPCRDVTDFGPGLADLVEDLFATMYAARGVGLAANQIGVDLRVFVYDCPDDEDVRHLGHVVNPRLVEADGVVIRGPEGCLSLPGLEAGTERYDHAVVEGFTATGDPVTVHGTGFFARCLQHECDHLAGTVYADHLTGWRRRKLMRQISRASWHRPSGPA
ncbi:MULTISPECIES: peptide deformylase [Streptomyces]|uniref:Peptide deformylase n=2 Tax=Streptomyces TaxID=1883 RepID=A0ABS9JJE1_9ACTN|nr:MULTISPECIES: peptide deformylase [Streptomyces]MCG0065690.1 peptide deformylase [Streptomyces tricolor]MYU28014.1 peptide deformylase [Streptomyces sp. SID7810]OYP18988.1 peptide deformylase [Streptomyces sp. FBKL.4005]CUW26889.1 Peptide deformylase [Streptomyces reticuli]